MPAGLPLPCLEWFIQRTYSFEFVFCLIFKPTTCTHTFTAKERRHFPARRRNPSQGDDVNGSVKVVERMEPIKVISAYRIPYWYTRPRRPGSSSHRQWQNAPEDGFWQRYRASFRECYGPPQQQPLRFRDIALFSSKNSSGSITTHRSRNHSGLERGTLELGEKEHTCPRPQIRPTSAWGHEALGMVPVHVDTGLLLRAPVQVFMSVRSTLTFHMFTGIEIKWRLDANRQSDRSIDPNGIPLHKPKALSAWTLHPISLEMRLFDTDK